MQTENEPKGTGTGCRTKADPINAEHIESRTRDRAAVKGTEGRHSGASAASAEGGSASTTLTPSPLRSVQRKMCARTKRPDRPPIPVTYTQTNSGGDEQRHGDSVEQGRGDTYTSCSYKERKRKEMHCVPCGGREGGLEGQIEAPSSLPRPPFPSYIPLSRLLLAPLVSCFLRPLVHPPLKYQLIPLIACRTLAPHGNSPRHGAHLVRGRASEHSACRRESALQTWSPSAALQNPQKATTDCGSDLQEKERGASLFARDAEEPVPAGLQPGVCLWMGLLPAPDRAVLQ